MKKSGYLLAIACESAILRMLPVDLERSVTSIEPSDNLLSAETSAANTASLRSFDLYY